MWRRAHEENYKHMKIVVGTKEISSPLPHHILLLLFGIQLLYSCHSSKVIYEILRLWYSDPPYHFNKSFYKIAIKNSEKCL